MTRGRHIFLILSLLLVVPLAATVLLGQDRRDDGEDSLYRFLSVFTEVLSLVRQAYVDEVPAEDLMAAALDGAPGALDPFSTYVPPEAVGTWEEVQRIGPGRSGLVLARQDGTLFVLSVLAGSPAAGAGMEPGDLISKIDDRSTRHLPLWRAMELFAHEPGTRVRLELFRRGERETAELELATFSPPAVTMTETSGLPLLTIPRLGPDSVAAVRDALNELRDRNARGLLTDLRGVGGSDPATAYEIAALFADGELGRMLSPRGVAETYTGAPPLWQGELVVLVNHATSGGAEILASVLRQRAGAELVGRRTFGHAGRRGEVEISNGGRLVLTTALYTGPDAEPLNEGLAPDDEVDGSDRTFADKDISLDDLILRRGLELLQERLEARQAA
ncbi:MAG: S41 family peptidase [Thermoanaerobaculia bacterium]